MDAGGKSQRLNYEKERRTRSQQQRSILNAMETFNFDQTGIFNYPIGHSCKMDPDSNGLPDSAK